MTMTNVSIPSITKRKRKISLQMGGKPVVSIITRSLSSTSPEKRIDIEYDESEPDLSDDEERILMYDDHNIPIDDEDDEYIEDGESTSKWKTNLSEVLNIFHHAKHCGKTR